MKTLLARIARILPKQTLIQYQPEVIPFKMKKGMSEYDIAIEWAMRARILGYSGVGLNPFTLVPVAHPQGRWDLFNSWWSAEMDTCIQELTDGTDKPANALLHIVALVAEKGYVPNPEQQAFLDAFDGDGIDEDIADKMAYRDYACGWDVVLRKPTPGAGDKHSPFPVVQVVSEEA